MVRDGNRVAPSEDKESIREIEGRMRYIKGLVCVMLPGVLQCVKGLFVCVVCCCVCVCVLCAHGLLCVWCVFVCWCVCVVCCCVVVCYTCPRAHVCVLDVLFRLCVCHMS